MKRLIPLLALLMVWSASQLLSQTSDFAVKKNFEQRYQEIKNRVDSSTTTAQLDSLKAKVDLLELDFSPRSAFLDKALYPETFQSSLAKLRTDYVITYDRVYLIQSRGIQIAELESKISFLSGRLDTLTSQRDSLFAQLVESKKSLAALREAMKRLTANLQAKDRLIFALVDSIFLPYGKDLNQMAEVQKEAISRKLEKANVVTRVYDIANDNVKFLDVTQLQAKDYANLVDQYQQYKTKWEGLREKMNAVTPAPAGLKATGTSGKSGRGSAAQTPAPAPGAQVDSLMVQWHDKLQHEFWAGVQKEFTTKEIPIKPFSNGQEFSANVREYAEQLKASGQDPSVFVDEVWKQHIDKDWREALCKESILGKTEYASLDAVVGDLSKEKVDLKFILYIVIILALLFGGWWFFIRKPKGQAAEPPPAPPAE